MLLGDTVDIMREVKGQQGHVKFILAAQFFKQFKRDGITHNAFDKIIREAIMACFYRCVSGEYAFFLNTPGVP